jgi:hypothetical protein
MMVLLALRVEQAKKSLENGEKRESECDTSVEE